MYISCIWTIYHSINFASGSGLKSLCRQWLDSRLRIEKCPDIGTTSEHCGRAGGARTRTNECSSDFKSEVSAIPPQPRMELFLQDYSMTGGKNQDGDFSEIEFESSRPPHRNSNAEACCPLFVSFPQALCPSRRRNRRWRSSPSASPRGGSSGMCRPRGAESPPSAGGRCSCSPWRSRARRCRG